MKLKIKTTQYATFENIMLKLLDLVDDNALPEIEDFVLLTKSESDSLIWSYVKK